MPRRLQSLLLATALLSLAGCASAQSNTRTEPSAQTQEAAPSRPMCALCPLKMEGTEVTASDVEAGAALTFTTATGDVGALRAQVAQMVERHNARRARASSPGAGCCCPQGDQGAGASASCPQGMVSCPRASCLPPGGPQGGPGQGGSGRQGRHTVMGRAMGMPMMAAEASVEEVPGGARMVLKAEDPSGVDALRKQVHQHAEMMSKGRCGCPAVRGEQGPQDSGS